MRGLLVYAWLCSIESRTRAIARCLALGNVYNYFRDYDATIGRYAQSDPIGLAGGISTYGYAGSNSLSQIDPTGLDTLVIVGFWVGDNPFGHVAIATTGSGIYSFGTATPYGSSVISYLLDQATRRDSSAFIIKTTPEQEQKILAYLR